MRPRAVPQATGHPEASRRVGLRGRRVSPGRPGPPSRQTLEGVLRARYWTGRTRCPRARRATIAEVPRGALPWPSQSGPIARLAVSGTRVVRRHRLEHPTWQPPMRVLRPFRALRVTPTGRTLRCLRRRGISIRHRLRAAGDRRVLALWRERIPRSSALASRFSTRPRVLPRRMEGRDR